MDAEETVTTPPETQLVQGLRAPFPYFGGKSRVAHIVWSRFGNVSNYVEAFFGSGATLLARPHAPQVETVNDLDCFIANFWRSLTFEPEAVADFADSPVNEADLHARHNWLVNQAEFRERMLTDPDFYDPKIAGYWVWGRCAWIAGGWCDWNNISKVTGRMGRSIPNMTTQGVHAERITRQGIHAHMVELANRLRRVRVVCGSWERVCTPAVCRGKTGIMLDPPYFDGLSEGLYANSDANVSGQVRQWAIDNGNNPDYLIALCGYEGEHKMPDDWETFAWKATGGFGGQRKDGTVNENAERERIWFSPACLKVKETLFAEYNDEEDNNE